MASDLRPGWYVVHNSLGETVLWRGDELWSGQNPEWPDLTRPNLPPDWTLGPRIDDLLRDAARYRWLRAHESFTQEIGGGDAVAEICWEWEGPLVELNADGIGGLIDAEIAREKERADG